MASFLIPIASFSLILFFLFAAPTVNGIVVDVDGNMVPNGGGEYYMRPYPSSEGAGPVGWVSEKNKCPLDITTSFTEETHVSTITLSSPFKSLFIPEGPIFIQFNDKDTPCESKPLWWFLKPTMGPDVHFLELGAGTDDFSLVVLKASLIIEDANIEGKHVYQLKYCELGGTMCRYVVEKPDNSGAIGIIYGKLSNGLKPFQFELTNAMKSYLKMRI